MTDIVERAEAGLAIAHSPQGMGMVFASTVEELLSELKAARKRLERLQKYVTQHTDLCICDKAGLGHYDFVSCKVHNDY